MLIFYLYLLSRLSAEVQSYLQQLFHNLNWYHCLTAGNAGVSQKSVLTDANKKPTTFFGDPLEKENLIGNLCPRVFSPNMQTQVKYPYLGR